MLCDICQVLHRHWICLLCVSRTFATRSVKVLGFMFSKRCLLLPLPCLSIRTERTVYVPAIPQIGVEQPWKA